MAQPLLWREASFESPTVDITGAIVERRQGTARLLVERLADGIELEMVVLAGGRFIMGSRRGEGYEDEQPQHEVAVPAFLVGRYPVTNEQYGALMGDHRGRFSGTKQPVDRVSWLEATEFCQRLAQASERPYRLPSEAEWEYACRAGTSTPFHFGPTITTDLANYNGFTYGLEPEGVNRHALLDVGSLPPNAFGLHDMHGTLWEWCADLWHDSYAGAPSDGSAWLTGGEAGYRVARGGSWHETPQVCRSAIRLRAVEFEDDPIYGCRVALTL